MKDVYINTREEYEVLKKRIEEAKTDQEVIKLRKEFVLTGMETIQNIEGKVYVPIKGEILEDESSDMAYKIMFEIEGFICYSWVPKSQCKIIENILYVRRWIIKSNFEKSNVLIPSWVVVEDDNKWKEKL